MLHNIFSFLLFSFSDLAGMENSTRLQVLFFLWIKIIPIKDMLFHLYLKVSESFVPDFLRKILICTYIIGQYDQT